MIGFRVCVFAGIKKSLSCAVRRPCPAALCAARSSSPGQQWRRLRLSSFRSTVSRLKQGCWMVGGDDAVLPRGPTAICGRTSLSGTVTTESRFVRLALKSRDTAVVCRHHRANAHLHSILKAGVHGPLFPFPVGAREKPLLVSDGDRRSLAVEDG